MRWKLFRRRFTVSAPRMIVRSHLPWPLRWAVVALVFGFSAAIAAWAFEFGKSIAGLDRDAKDELARLRVEVSQLREERDKSQSIANTAESLLKAERAAQDRLAQQLRQLEADNLALKGDLGFFERLLPAAGNEALAVRGLQVDVKSPGQVRYQLLVMQPGRPNVEFSGRYDLTLTGTLESKPWTMTLPGGAKPLRFKQYARVEGVVEVPGAAVVKTVQARVIDAGGGVLGTQIARL